MINLNSIEYSKATLAKDSANWKLYTNQLEELSSTWVLVEDNAKTEIEKVLTSYFYKGNIKVYLDTLKIVSTGSAFNNFQVLINDENNELKKIVEINLSKSDYMSKEFDQLNFEYYGSANFDSFEVLRLKTISDLTKIVIEEGKQNLINIINERVSRFQVCKSALIDKMDCIRIEKSRICSKYKNNLSDLRRDKFLTNGWENNETDNQFFNIDTFTVDIMLNKRYVSLGSIESIKVKQQNNMETRKTHTLYVTYKNFGVTKYENIKLTSLGAFYNIYLDEEKEIKAALDSSVSVNVQTALA